MNRGGQQGAVVVAVVDDGSAGDAVDWAAAEAATRGRPGGAPRARLVSVRGWWADSQSADTAWLNEVAESACRDAGGAPVELLGDYLPLLADAATSGREPRPSELEAVGMLGRRAAELGVSACTAVQLSLSAARRLWQQLPMVIRSRDNQAVRAAAAAVLHVVDGAVASLAEGYAEARRQMARWEETLRREFIEDLLRGDADVGRFAERAEPFGLDMLRPHQVALAAPTGRLDGATQAISSLEHALVQPELRRARQPA